MAYFNGNKNFLIALKGKDGENGGCNPNLLINGDFKVNQREETKYTSKATTSSRTYTVDRWHIFQRDIAENTVSVKKDGIIFDSVGEFAYLAQTIENYESLVGRTVTFSVKLENMSSASAKLFIEQGGVYCPATCDISGHATGVFSCTGVLVSGYSQLKVGISKNHTAPMQIKLYEAKLEIGEVATPFSPRPYAEELLLCQRYYYKQNHCVHNLGILHSNNQVAVMINLPTTMRTSPTITYDKSAEPDYTRTALFFGGGSYKTNSVSFNAFCGDKIRLIAIVDSAVSFASAMVAVYRPWQSMRFDAEIY